MHAGYAKARSEGRTKQGGTPGGTRRGARMGVLRCLSGDTVLQTADGPRPVEDLVGERPYLFACHPDDGHVNLVRADRVFVSDRERPVVRVALDDGSSLDCTPEHPFMLDDGSFEEAHRLREGNTVRVLDDAMKGLSSTEMHVRTLAPTGYGKTAPPTILREILERSDARSELVVDVDPAGEHGRVRSSWEFEGEYAALGVSSDPGPPASPLLSFRDDGTLLDEPPRVYGGRGSTTRRVVGVEELPGRAREVYDVSLPALHNFAAGGAGTFVHNCGHPGPPRRA